MRRINAEIQGGKVQEYSRISSLSDAEVQYLDKQKIQDLVGGSIILILNFDFLYEEVVNNIKYFFQHNHYSFFLVWYILLNNLSLLSLISAKCISHNRAHDNCCCTCHRCESNSSYNHFFLYISRLCLFHFNTLLNFFNF